MITPYTSFFVDEPTAPAGNRVANQADMMQQAVAAESKAGAGAVAKAEAVNDLQRGDQVASGQPDTVRQAGGKTFILKEGVWVDTEYDGTANTAQVTFGSDAYFTLVSAKPERARWFAVGTPMIIVLDGSAYAIAEGESDAGAVQYDTSAQEPLTLSAANGSQAPPPGGGGGAGPWLVWAGAAAAAGTLWLLRRRKAA